MKKPLLILSLFVFVTLVITNGNNQLQAKKNGKTGATNNNSKSCGECHASAPNSNVVVSITSETGSFEVEPESKTKFTLTIKSPSGVAAGCDIAVKSQLNGTTYAGTLEAVAGSGLGLSKNELVHTQPKSITNGQTSFDFYWIAPKTPGDYYLQAVALSANGNNKDDNGDIWNFAQTQIIKVKSPNSVELDAYSKPFVIYPNPISTNSQIIINNFNNFNKIEYISIVNNNGQIVSTINSDINALAHIINNLANGYYVIHFKLSGKDYIEKIIKID